MDSKSPNRSRHARQLALVLSYARDGWPVFPVCPETKGPLTKHGFHDATTYEAKIREWWQRWPSALVAIPTGSTTGLWVLDVDGPIGRANFAALMARLGVELPADLSPVIIETPRGGLHVYFKLGPGQTPRTRAGDIAVGLDTRGEGGYIIAPGNELPDGRLYRHIDLHHDLAEAPEAPRDLLYIATFGSSERAEIVATAKLEREIHSASASEWRQHLDAHRAAKAARIRARITSDPPDDDAMRRQAFHDLRAEAAKYAILHDGRRNELFRSVCRVAKYAANGVLAAAEIVEAFITASEANGAIARYGVAWVRGTVQRGLERGTNDALPPLAREFREGAA